MEEETANTDNHMETEALGQMKELQMSSPFTMQMQDECKEAPQLDKQQEQEEEIENEKYEDEKEDKQQREESEEHRSSEEEESYEEEEYEEHEEEKTAEHSSGNKGESVSRALKSNNNNSNEDNDNPASYQELPRFCTWRKHVRDLYQQLVHIDLVWESTVAQFMPYVSMKNNLLTHTLLSATRTSGQEQCFLQLLNVTLPASTATLENQLGTFSEVTGEVGGYGMAPTSCGVKIERRILHDGDVLAARAMPANPLLLASSSSNGHLYVFDWSRVSLNKFPNDPPRPRGPLPPNALTHEASEEERTQYHKRMRELNAIAAEQDR